MEEVRIITAYDRTSTRSSKGIEGSLEDLNAYFNSPISRLACRLLGSHLCGGIAEVVSRDNRLFKRLPAF